MNKLQAFLKENNKEHYHLIYPHGHLHSIYKIDMEGMYVSRNSDNTELGLIEYEAWSEKQIENCYNFIQDLLAYEDSVKHDLF